MVAYTRNADGDWDDDTKWDGGAGYPDGSDDTATIGAYAVTLDTVESCGALTMTGTATGESSRSRLTVANGGKLTLEATATMNEYHTFIMNPGSEVDIKGNNIELTQDGGTANLNKWTLLGSALAPFVLRDSVGNTGEIIRSTGWGQPIRCDLYIQYGAFIDLGGWHIGTNNWASGINIEVYDSAFTDCGTIVLGSNINVANTLKLERLDFRGTPSGPNSPAGRFLDVAQTTSGVTAANINVEQITVKGDAGTEELRFHGYELHSSNLVLDMVKHTRITKGPHDISDSFIKLIDDNSIGIGNPTPDGDELYRSYIYGGHDNPHPLGGSVTDVHGGVVELKYDEEAHTDAADTFIVNKSANSVFEDVVILDEEGGVIMNALSPPVATGNHVLRHCTYRGKVDVYGCAYRDEYGGSFNGTLDCLSNIFVNTGTFANSRGFNFAVTAAATINSTHNVWNNIDDIYYTATAQTFITDEELTDSPTFHDSTRDLASWAASVGEASTSQAAIDYMLLANGYDAVTKKQIAANATRNDVFYASDDVTYPSRLKAEVWVRAGHTVTSAAHQNTGHDGGHRGIIDDAPVAPSSGVPYAIIEAVSNSVGSCVTNVVH